MQLGLRRHHGDLRAARQTIGRALFLCAATTVAGFGSNVWSSNGGLVSLGRVCAAGIACAYLTSVFLLPMWWRAVRGRDRAENLLDPATGVRPSPGAESCARVGSLDSSGSPPVSEVAAPGDGRTPAFTPPPSSPSSLYRAGLWRVGLGLVRVLPHRVCAGLSRLFMDLYWLLAPRRREIVMQNLVPALNGDRAGANRKARELFHQFGRKLIDLWRYEAGLPIEDLLGEYTGWEHFLQAKAEKRSFRLRIWEIGNLAGPG